jgi:hypothetical protein
VKSKYTGFVIAHELAGNRRPVISRVQHRTLTALIYLSASAAASCFLLSRTLQAGARSAAFFFYLCFFAVPLLFVFAYPRFLFTAIPPHKNRSRSAALLHVLGAATTTFLFVCLAVPFWKNPLCDADSLALLLVPLIALPVFLVSGLSLLLKSRSSLATIASFLFWPYWLLLALVNVDRFFQETVLYTVFWFLCFSAPVLFAFAAGAVSYRPELAHSTAFAGLVALPWFYWSLRDRGLGNVWLMFNLSGREIGMYPPLYAELTIFAITLITLAIVTAGLRLIPSRWQFRKLSLCERTWPASAISLLVLAIWFSQSVMPYRIPGAVDYSDWPILQILHVEKHGLQFHETCVSVWGRLRHPLSVSFSGNDRRLLQYRFRQKHASGELPDSFLERVRGMVQSSDRAKEKWDEIKPLRSWNVDGWYFRTEGVGLKAYTTDQGARPPQEIVDLFRDLEKIPRSRETQSELKDVCLGFCYDPISGLGWLYANHRCRNNGHGVVCR